MPHSLSNARVLQFALTVPVTVFLCACSQNLVKIPPASLDRAPVVTITGFVLNDSGSLGQSIITSPTTVNTPAGTQVQIFARAENVPLKGLGGVKQLQLTISQGSKSLYAITITSAPNLMGSVYDILSIPGSNGAGGIGNQLIAFTMNSDAVIVTSTATNFNNQTATVVATYKSNCGCNPFTQTADAHCNCTTITCPPPQQLGINGCCPVGWSSCNGDCIPPDQDCCSSEGDPSGTHCCSSPPNTTCPTGYSCCGTTQCCGPETICVNGACQPSFSVKENLKDHLSLSLPRSKRPIKPRKQ